MVNLMCQFDGTAGCSNIWSDIALSVSMRMFLDEVRFKLVDQVKHIVFPNMSKPYLICWRLEWNNKKIWIILQVREAHLFFCLQTWTKHQLFLVLEPADLLTETTPLSVSACELILQILGLASLHNHVSRYMYILHISLVLFL